ncbi:GGDEF domain-containing protein [Saccharomonospora sp. NPDC046836]|uniref:GGDEF domain-containing protein n=1 Tax=Saccharomonospora sp. NPDC046836 TaxID=3156921 RepID=UPI0033D68C41
MEAGNGAHPQKQAHDPSGLLAAHESIAGKFATQGDWRRAYEHLRAALELARSATACTRPHIPEQFRLEVEQLRRERAQARRESLTDSLTATYNRRYLDRRLADLPSPSVALVDLDLFKDINDRFGHQVGDQVLQRVVGLLQQSLPPGAFCARYGGEEFVLVIPDAPAGTAVSIAERARAKVAEYPWERVQAGLSVTVSVGVAPHPQHPADPREQLDEADSLLYAAKRAGRNIVAFRDNGDLRLLPTLRAHAAGPCP